MIEWPCLIAALSVGFSFGVIVGIFVCDRKNGNGNGKKPPLS